MRIGLLAIGGWLVAAVLTVGVSWSAISVVRDAVAPASEVAAALPTPDETSATTPPTASRTPARPGPTASRSASASTLASASGQGGTATARCDDGRPTFINVTPRPGYQARKDGAEVEFRSSSGRTEMTATCVGGARIVVEDKDEGGGSGRGGGDDD